MSDAKIAEVEAAQIVPAEELAPQPIGPDLVAEQGSGGEGCSFVPADGGTGPILVTRPDVAYMRLDGRMVRFAADKGSTRLPLDGWSKYVGKSQSLQLTFDNSGEGRGAAQAARSGDALLNVKDRHERTVYEAAGTVECGP